MATQKPHPITHYFKEVNEGRYATVQHFELSKCENGSTQLSELINISKDRKCAQSAPTFWLKTRNGQRWSNWITGLFKTEYPNIFKGDIDKKKHLLIFKFSKNYKSLIVDCYLNYYTGDLSNILPQDNR